MRQSIIDRLFIQWMVEICWKTIPLNSSIGKFLNKSEPYTNERSRCGLSRPIHKWFGPERIRILEFTRTLTNLWVQFFPRIKSCTFHHVGPECERDYSMPLVLRPFSTPHWVGPHKNAWWEKGLGALLGGVQGWIIFPNEGCPLPAPMADLKWARAPTANYWSTIFFRKEFTFCL